MRQIVEELRWKKFECLDDGFVCLVDVMGDDHSVVQAARVSYGRDERSNREGEPLSEADVGVIRAMMRLGHTTPFEMAEVKFLVRCPMDVWRQWIRHRTANVNEYSTRYKPAIDSMTRAHGKWRTQSKSSKQGSEGEVADQVTRDMLDCQEHETQATAREVYERRLAVGVALEQARKDLPLSTYTEAYWKCDLHNLLHFLGLRMHSHAQAEIREYATAMGERIVAPLFPTVWRAFLDYHPHMGGMRLSRMEVETVAAIFKMIESHKTPAKVDYSAFGMGDREAKEFAAKLERLCPCQ